MEDDDALVRGMKRSPWGLLGFGVVVAVVPFVVSFAVDEFDYVKLGGGALVCLVALVALIRAFGGANRVRNVALSVVVLLVGLFHVATSGALGAIGFDPFGMSESDAREWLAAHSSLPYQLTLCRCFQGFG